MDQQIISMNYIKIIIWKQNENRLFIANYIKKSNELFLTIKNFNDKIKEIDNKLNRKMKNFNIDSDNNIFYYELSLFEKRVIDFQNSQINYYKELIHILNKGKNEEETQEINFDTFYNKILLNNNCLPPFQSLPRPDDQFQIMRDEQTK